MGYFIYCILVIVIFIIIDPLLYKKYAFFDGWDKNKDWWRSIPFSGFIYMYKHYKENK